MYVKLVFNELERMHQSGFDNWYSKVVALSRSYGIDPDHIDPHNAKAIIKYKITEHYKQSWRETLYNNDNNTVLRTYRLFKNDFYVEPYLYIIKEAKHRIALTRLRASSHHLEIERGRYTRPKTPVNERLCPNCGVIEDEEHFLVHCEIYRSDRNIMYSKILTQYGDFRNLNPNNKFIFLMTNNDPIVLNALGKFVHKAFQLREVWAQ